MRWVGRVLCALFWMFCVFFVGDSASWATDEPVGPSPSASASSTSSGTPAPAPTATETVTVTPAPQIVHETVTATPEPSPAPSAPGVNSGVSVDPTTGAVRMGEHSATALGVAAWLLSVVLGLWTAWLVLP
jgi:hypothetical protein